MKKQGLAKASFTKLFQRSPWLPFKQNMKGHQWPLLDQLLETKSLNYLDYVIVHRLMRNHSSVGQEVALFICHMILAAREGHLCIQATHESLIPSVSSVWKNEEGQPLTSELSRELTCFILQGVQAIPQEILTESSNINSITSTPLTPICREGNSYYLQKNWMHESLFLKQLKRHLKSPLNIHFEIDAIDKDLSQLCHEKRLLPEQAEAIAKACFNPLTLLTGGPGTGKTYTAGHLIKIFWNHLSQEQKKTFQVVLAAPTGKAAANLQRSLSKVATSLDGFPSVQAKTLHALLGMKRGSSPKENIRLSADLVIIDESSMMDVRMMASLFEALKPGSHLILLGDKHQLPSIEAGSPFVDLINIQHSYPNLKLPCTMLSVCLRTELKSLIDFAQSVNLGLGREVLNSLASSKTNEVKRLHFSSVEKEAQHEIVAYTLSYFQIGSIIEKSSQQLLDAFNQIRLLSPLRKGPLGVESLNRMIYEKLHQYPTMYGKVAIPIMITANDHQQGLFNGETGVLIKHHPVQSPLQETDYAIFPSRQEAGEIRRISAVLLPRYEWAYCLSVHKSQGSEFDHVILLLPEGAELFGREVFYTAITRARKSIEIYGSDAVILKTIVQQGLRLSGIERGLVSMECDC